jgi:hypothetical protein
VYVCESRAHTFHGFFGREGAQGQIRARSDFSSLPHPRSTTFRPRLVHRYIGGTDSPPQWPDLVLGPPGAHERQIYERPESNESLRHAGAPVLSGRERPKGCLFLPPPRHPLVPLLPRFGAGFECLLARAGSCRELTCRRASPKAPDDASWSRGSTGWVGVGVTSRDALALTKKAVKQAKVDPV